MSAPPAIDLNSDLGESFGAWSLGDDAALLAVVSSANIACGAHAGNLASMRAAACRATSAAASVIITIICIIIIIIIITISITMIILVIIIIVINITIIISITKI